MSSRPAAPLPAEATAILASLQDEAVELLREAIRCDTSNPPGNEAPLAEALASYLRGAGLAPRLLGPEPHRTSVIARLPGAGPDRPMLLSAHLDVVPARASEWRHPPFAAELHDGYVWGRGAVDMKAMAVMSAVVMKALAREGGTRRRDVIFAGVADEEAGGGRGAGWLVANHPEEIRAEVGVTEIGGFTLPFGETTLVPVQVAEKGVQWLRLVGRGLPGHASLPHDDNAILKVTRAASRLGSPLRFRVVPETRRFLAELGRAQGGASALLTRLLTTSWLGPRLVPLLPPERRRPLRAMLHDLATPTMLAGGLGPNVIPGEASCHVDARYLPGTTREELLRLVAERVGPEVEVEPLEGLPPVVMPYPTPLYEAIERVMAAEVPGARVVPYLMPGFTDAKHYAKLGMTVYGFAPVALAKDEPFASLYHAPDERISVAGFLKGLVWLHRVVREVVAPGPPAGAP